MKPLHPALSTAITLLALIAIPLLDFWWHSNITGFTVLLTLGVTAWTYLNILKWIDHRRKDTERSERLRRHAEQVRICRQKGEAENDCLNSILGLLAVVAIVVFLFAPLCRGADLDSALMELTQKFAGEVLLSPDDFSQVRDLITRTAVIIRQMQTAPAGMPAELQNQRLKIRVRLEKIQDELLQITVAHAESCLRRLQRVEPGGAK